MRWDIQTPFSPLNDTMSVEADYVWQGGRQEFHSRNMNLTFDENGGTQVKITEEGDVSNVLFRFMSRYVFGHTATIDSYLAAIARHFGEESN